MEIASNPYRLTSNAPSGLADIPFPSTDAARAVALYQRCPKAAATPLTSSEALAAQTGVGSLQIKDERSRMGLGSFKALGAAYTIARDAQERALSGVTYVTASAGNHGLSVAAGASAFGAKSVVYIAQTVPEAFADRLRAEGAEVVRAGDIYEESMAAAAQAAKDNGWALLSDSSWPGYTDRPHTLMEGYLILMAEVIAEIDAPPTHIFLQAGVGGLAGAAAAMARATWGDDPVIVVVEPEVAPALAASITAGKPVIATGPVSSMGRLDCKEPSLIALKGLARDADFFALISEAEGEAATEVAAANGFDSTPSGTAGLAALLASEPHRDALSINAQSRALIILSEGPEG